MLKLVISRWWYTWGNFKNLFYYLLWSHIKISKITERLFLLKKCHDINRYYFGWWELWGIVIFFFVFSHICRISKKSFTILCTASLFTAPALVQITVISHLDYFNNLRGLSVSLLVLVLPSRHTAASPCIIFKGNVIAYLF